MENENFRYTSDIKGYQSAIWDFLLEHSHIEKNGKLFIKFHVEHRKNFENRVLGRWKYNYHREDVQAKAKKLLHQKQQYQLQKRLKKKAYKEQKLARLKLLKLK